MTDRSAEFHARAERLAELLATRNDFTGEFRTDAAARSMYAANASICHRKPAAVARPKSATDVATLLALANEFRVPVTPRGAGSSVAGQSLGNGLIVDFAAHLNRLLAVDAAAQTVTVEPGIIRDRLHTALAAHGLFFPPDPSSGNFCSIGGMIANNSGGAHSLKYGTTKHYIVGLDILLADGSRATITAPRRADGPAVLKNWPGNGNGITAGDQRAIARGAELAAKVGDLVRANREILAAECPRTFRHSHGYNLFEVETPDGLTDLTRLLCGSEGTLGVIVSATLRLLKPPTARVGLILKFADEAAAFGAVASIAARFSPSTIQAMSRDLLDAAQSGGGPTLDVPAILAQMLLVEFDGDDRDELLATAKSCADAFASKNGPAFAAELADSPAALSEIWLVRKTAAAVLSRLPGPLRPTRWIEDGAVPPEKLPEFVAGLRQMFREHGIDAALFGHAGQGLLHFSPRLDPHAPDFTRKLKIVGEAHARLLRAVGGVPSGEHGDGLLRSKFVPEFFPKSFPAMVAAKGIFDPQFQLNPAMIVPSPDADARANAEFLRVGDDFEFAVTGTRFDAPALRAAVELCHGCGHCRSYCPVVELGDREEFLPRAKANVLREWIAGRVPAGEVFGSGSGTKAVVDHCLNCGLCLSQCPTHVDIPGISATFQAEFRAANGGKTDVAERLLSRPDWLAGAAGRVPLLANALLKSRVVRRWMAALTGIASAAPLPIFSRKRVRIAKPKTSRAVMWRGKEVREVAIFPTCESRHADQDEVSALAAILAAAGLRPVLLADAPCCGRPQISGGFADAARAKFVRQRRHITEQFRAGRPVLIPSPSCLPPFRRDVPRLSPDDAELQSAAEWCVDACQFLLDVLPQTELPSAMQARAVADHRALAVHAPCSLRAENMGEAPAKLLRLVGLRGCAEIAGARCCGALGTFSLKAAHIAEAEFIGARMAGIIGDMNADAIASPAGNCRRWLERQTGVPALHPLVLIANLLPASDGK